MKDFTSNQKTPYIHMINVFFKQVKFVIHIGVIISSYLTAIKFISISYWCRFCVNLVK